MNLHLYKVFDLTNINDSGESPMDCCRVMTEKDLRREFMWAYKQGGIPHDLIDDYKGDPDYKKENWNDMNNLSIGTMIDMLNDIPCYVCGEGYYILETDIEFEVPDDVFEGLEEIQSICIGADSPDALEHGERDPIEELQCCREDISAISNITEKLLTKLGE